MTNIIEFIPKDLYELAKLFPKEEPLYIVGGFIRDAIEFNTASSDIDIASSYTPEEVQQLLEGSRFKIYEASARLGTIIIKGDRSYEYTAFRVDSYPIGNGVHAPSQIKFTKSLEVDAQRRDFKCNALYFNLATNKIEDPLHGLEDIENKIISTANRPEITLSQDGLRILRLIRMISVLGYDVQPETYSNAEQLVDRLEDISVERIQVELIKILNGKYVYKALCTMRDIGVLRQILPDIADGEGVIQNTKFHKYDVLEHTFRTVEAAPVKIRLAALFHDIAKPKCLKEDGNMYMHAVVGAKMTRDILAKLKFSNETINYTCELVGAHMFDVADMAKPNTVRRHIVEHPDNIEDIVDLQIADAIGTGLISGPLRPSKTREQIVIMKERNIPFRIKELKINGNDLIKIGYKGAEIGKMLNEIFNACLYESIKNEKEDLIRYAEKQWRRRYGNSNINL